MSTIETPESTEITAAWLDGVLRASGAIHDARVTAVELAPVEGGLMTTMTRATLTLDRDEPGAPGSVLIKRPTEDPGSLGLATAMGFYENEVGFYRDIAPMLPDMRFPVCHLAQRDEQTGAFTLVLEDVVGSRPGDVLTMCTPDECAAVIEQLVRFQAPLWNSPQVAALDWLSNPARTHAMFDHFTAGLEPFVERFGHGLRPEHVALFEELQPQAGEWARSWTAPSVVQHGDFRTDNLLFGIEADASPVTVIDFQTLRVGPPGIDLAYFLGASLDTETRRAVERDLLDEYHRGLVAAGVADWAAEDCWRSYCEGALYGVFLFVGTASQVVSTERGDRVIVDQIGRYADMALDLDAKAAAGL